MVGVGHDVMAGHTGPAAGRSQQGGEHPHRGGFPGAVGPKEPEDLAFTHLKVDPVDSDEVPEGTAKACGLNGKGHRGPPAGTRRQRTSG